MAAELGTEGLTAEGGTVREEEGIVRVADGSLNERDSPDFESRLTRCFLTAGCGRGEVNTVKGAGVGEGVVSDADSEGEEVEAEEESKFKTAAVGMSVEEGAIEGRKNF